jgi:hypothetical protein
MTSRYLRSWACPCGQLRAWRSKGNRGPRFLRVGKCCKYPAEALKAYIKAEDGKAGQPRSRLRSRGSAAGSPSGDRYGAPKSCAGAERGRTARRHSGRRSGPARTLSCGFDTRAQSSHRCSRSMNGNQLRIMNKPSIRAHSG